MNKNVMVGAAVAGAVLAYMLYKSAGKLAEGAVTAVGDAAHAINPFNDNNIINRGAESLYQVATGSTGSIGGDIYDATHGGKLDGAITPTSENNLAYRAVNGSWGLVTGDPNFDLGSKIYDWLH